MEGDGVLGGMSAEPVVQELDGVDGVGAGTVEDLLAAGGARSYNDNRNRRILSRNAGGGRGG